MMTGRTRRIRAYKAEHGCDLLEATRGVERQDRLRGDECRAALAGIPDPAAFVAAARALAEAVMLDTSGGHFERAMARSTAALEALMAADTPDA